jgi:hypothetical protein
MRETLMIIGLVVLSFGLRSSRTKGIRKLGALTFLAASFYLFYVLTGSIVGGLFGVAIWFFLPWIELLTRIRQMRHPLNNRLSNRKIPDSVHFPNATEAADAMEEAGFEHVSDCGWEWAGMQQYFRFFWHPEERAVASVCLCEQDNVAFAYILVSSQSEDGRIWRTTNFPFTQSLQSPPHVHWNYVPCERDCFHGILADHRRYLGRVGVAIDSLLIPDPEKIEDTIEQEMRKQVDHNLAVGLIRLEEGRCFRYSVRGLVFLWWQFVKDAVRLC